MYPMLREGVELEQYEASEDPYADFPETWMPCTAMRRTPMGISLPSMRTFSMRSFMQTGGDRFPFRHPSLTTLMTSSRSLSPTVFCRPPAL